MQDNKKEIHFEKLTPTGNVDLRVYEPAIDFAFKENDVKNVAITGAYGIGKSSVLESYKKKHRKISFLHVSMTNFDEKDGDKIKDKIEGNIINQLIHQIPLKVISQTNFRRKEKLNRLNVYKADIHMKFINVVFSFFSSGMGALLLYSAIVTLICLMLYKLYILQVNKNILKKIKVQGNEIELFQKDDDNCLDKYLNEIIFMIKNAAIQVFVFEDIDRFNDQAITVFEKLREINRVINISTTANDDKIIFMYLVRDDLLTSEERTKFFDYIIPVVPILSGNNAYDKLIEFLSPDIDYKEFDEQFLRRSTLFIDDMRVLKSISNEFKIYYKMMDIKVNINKMMAIIMYKNLFPQDFSKLRKRNGYVYNIFKERENKASEELKKVKEEKKELENQMESNFAQNGYKYIDEDKIKVKEYEHRIKLLETAPLNKIITRDNQQSFFNIIECSGERKDKFEEIMESSYFGIIKYFIMNGYIDEKYDNYLTIFYGNNIDINDKNYILGVSNKESIDKNY